MERSIKRALEQIHGETVAKPAMEPLAGDASDRSYYRVKYDADGGERSVIVMALAEDPNPFASEEVQLYHDEIDELPFVNIHRYLSSIGAPVPGIIRYDESEGFLLLEDLGDALLLHALKRADENEIERLYEKALDALAHLQANAKPDKSCMAFQKTFSKEMFDWEFDHFTEYGVEKRLGVVIQQSDKDVIVRHTRSVSKTLNELPRVFCHRDYHSRNLLLKDDRIYMIDFQDALLAPAVYDLESLLRDSYFDPGMPMVERLTAYFRDALAERGGEDYDGERLLELMRLQAVQRNLKAAGRFGYIDIVKNNSSYLADIPRTLSYVKANLEALPEHHELLETYQKYTPELR